MFKIQNSNTNLFLSIETQGYLYDIGWIESYKEKNLVIDMEIHYLGLHILLLILLSQD